MKTPSSKSHKQKAFTLLEVLLASVIVGGALTVALASMNASLRTDRKVALGGNALEITANVFGKFRCGEIAVGDVGVETIEKTEYRWELSEQTTGPHGRLLICQVDFNNGSKVEKITKELLVKP